jgi:hypothetical protein
MNELENGMVLGYERGENNYIDPENAVRCCMCNEVMDATSDDVIFMMNGYIHEDCLDDYCHDSEVLSDYSVEFAEENKISEEDAAEFTSDNFSDFMDFVRRAS